MQLLVLPIAFDAGIMRFQVHVYVIAKAKKRIWCNSLKYSLKYNAM